MENSTANNNSTKSVYCLLVLSLFLKILLKRGIIMEFIPNEELAVKNLTAKFMTGMFAYIPQTSWQRIAENVCKEMTTFFMENPNTFKISSQQDYETMLEYAVFGIPVLKAFDI